MEIRTHIDKLFYAPLILVLGFLIERSVHAPAGDYGNYYYASKFLLEGNWGTWIYDPATFNLEIYHRYQQGLFLNYTPVPPLSALVYLPFSWFDIMASKLLWNALNAVAFVFTTVRMFTFVKADKRLLLLLPFLFFVPLRNTMYEGQSYLLIFSLLAEGFISYMSGRLIVAAVLWALAIHLKITPGVVLCFLLLQKDFKASAWLIFCAVTLLILSIPVVGFNTWWHYFMDILPRLFAGEINNTYAVNYQSMQVLLKTIFVSDVLHNPSGLFHEPRLYSGLLLSFNLVVYGLAILCSLSGARTGIRFSAWIITSMLVSGYGNSFSLLLLGIPALLMFREISVSKARWLIVLLLFAVVNIQVFWFKGLPLFLQFPRLYLLLILFVLVVISCNIRLRFSYLMVLFVPWLIPALLKPTDSSYLLKQEEALLVYNYELKGNELILHYFDHAPAQKKIMLPFHADMIRCNPDSSVIRSRVWTKKHCIVNDSIEVFLSDENRGAGFYTLRYTKRN